MKQVILAIGFTFLSLTSFAAVGVHCESAATDNTTVDFTMPSQHACDPSAIISAIECVGADCRPPHTFRTSTCSYSENPGVLSASVPCGSGGQCNVVQLNRTQTGQWSGTYIANVGSVSAHQTNVLCTMNGF